MSNVLFYLAACFLLGLLPRKVAPCTDRDMRPNNLEEEISRARSRAYYYAYAKEFNK